MSELITDSSVSLYVQNLLHRAPLLIQFRPDIEHCFLTKRTQEFSLIFRIASFLWLALYTAILLGAWLNFDYIFKDTGYMIWQSAFLVTGAIIVAMNICAYIPKTHEFIHQNVVAPAATLILYQLLVGSVAYPDGYFNVYASYNIIITMIVTIYSLRLLWQKSTLIILCSSVMAYASIFINGWHTPVLQFLHAFVLIAVVLLSISFFVERRERLGFINEILVVVKSSELARINAYLATIAREDALCGLANRRAFDDCLETEWERARREEQPLTLLFIDIDHFKLYNDTYGHAAGDDCLRQIGQAMKNALLRPADSVARYGGEEFVVLLPATDAQGAEEVAERIIRAIDVLAIPHKRSLVAFHVTASIGICSIMPHERNTISNLVENADAALYKAKTAGRRCFKHYQEPQINTSFNFNNK
jgi:diguanylate cyclase (GGDEF)-like protein